MQSLCSDRAYFRNEFIGLSQLPGFQLPIHKGKLGVVWHIDSVRYIDKEMKFLSDISDKNLQDIWMYFDRSVFVKPTCFHIQEEVRIIFRPAMVDSEAGRVYFLPNLLRDPMMVPFESVLDLVETDYGPPA
jgi:hypothetical protein